MAFRGGRGGRGGGGAGSMGGHMLPFEVDTALESEINAYREKETGDDNDEWIKQLYPPLKTYPQPSATPYERRLIQKRREHRAAMRNGPFFIDIPRSGLRDPANFNAFEDQPTFGNRRTKRRRGLPDLKTLPIVTEFFPPELQSVVVSTSNEDTTQSDARKKQRNMDLLRKRRIDKLAQFDENADPAGLEDDNDDDPKDNVDDGGVDDVEEPVDDDFSEDDDDVGNDYNAEKYFDDGEGGDDDFGGGGDDGGEDY